MGYGQRERGTSSQKLFIASAQERLAVMLAVANASPVGDVVYHGPWVSTLSPNDFTAPVKYILAITMHPYFLYICYPYIMTQKVINKAELELHYQIHSFRCV